MEKEKNWESFLRESIEQNKIRIIKEEKKKKSYENLLFGLKKLIPIQIVIGIIAASILYAEFGLKELGKIILSWIIGITLVATLITAAINRVNLNNKK